MAVSYNCFVIASNQIVGFYTNPLRDWYSREESINKEISKSFPPPIDQTHDITESLPDMDDRWLSPNISLRVYEWSEHIDKEALPDILVVDYIKIYQKKK